MCKKNSEEYFVKTKKQAYDAMIDRIKTKGGYIFGTGKLGKYVANQFKKNNLVLLGYIDNNPEAWGDNVFSPKCLRRDDVVIIASIYYYEIEKQLERIGIKQYAYYENIALVYDGFETYYQGFQGWFKEFDENLTKYECTKDILADETSVLVFEFLMNYKKTLDSEYLHKARVISENFGCQDFDKVIVDQFDGETCFFDVGGCDASTTLRFIELCPDYKKVFYIEPDSELMRLSKERLMKYKRIEYLEAGAGEDNKIARFDPVGLSAGKVTDKGDRLINIIKLDDYIVKNSYVKMDIEGSEYQAICGMKSAIESCHPMLGISVYHLPGDIHRLISLVLQYNKEYKVYMRHYTDSYADTIAYFVME